MAAVKENGTFEVDGIKVTMTHAIHSCGILDGGGKLDNLGAASIVAVRVPGGTLMAEASSRMEPATMGGNTDGMKPACTPRGMRR